MPLKNEKQLPEVFSNRVIRFELTSSTIISVILIAAGFWLLAKLVTVILVLVMALIIVCALIPMVKWLEKRNIHRNLAIAIVFTTLAVTSILFITMTIPDLLLQLQRVLEQFPLLQARLIDYLNNSPLTLPLALWLGNIKYNTLVLASALSAWQFTTNVLELFAYTFLTMFLALYIMIDRDRLRGGFFAIVPRAYHIRLSRVMVNLETIVGGYIRGQLLTSFLMSVFIFILLSFAGVEAALALALFGGAADVLPYIGIFLTMVPVVLAAVSKGTAVTIIVFLLLLIYEEVEGRVLIPVIYGKTLRLPSAVILFSLLVGATLMGLAGALLALPLAAAIRMLIIELRIDLPGQPETVEDAELKKMDELGEKEYRLRTAGMPAREAAAIAVEISGERKLEEENPTPDDETSAN
jgi:predicted PurR-regulated permease PerM